MGKLYEHLKRQLKSNEFKKDAEDCIKIYKILKEMNNGSIWHSDWQLLVNVKIVGTYPNSKPIYKPNKEGYIFLKGIEAKEKEREAGVRYISVQTAIMSHLSDAQELMSMAVGFGTVSSGYVSVKKRSADTHINFAKQLVLNYPDTSVKVSENELNELWNKTM